VPFQSLPPHCCQTGMALTVAAKTAAEVMKFLMFGDVGVVIVVLKWKFPGYDIFWYDESALYIIKSLIPTTQTHSLDSRPVGPWQLRV
jgi:hypothetical protein